MLVRDDGGFIWGVYNALSSFVVLLSVLFCNVECFVLNASS